MPDSQVNVSEFFYSGSVLLLRSLAGAGQGYLECCIQRVQSDRVLLNLPAEKVRTHFNGADTAEIILSSATSQLHSMPVHLTYGETDCWVTISEDIVRHLIQLRRHLRIACQFPVKIYDSDNDPSQALSAQTVNFSAGGMQFIANQPFKPNKLLYVVFQPEINSTVYEMDAEVISCAENAGKEAYSSFNYRVSVRFVNINRQLEDRLIGLCFRIELQQRRYGH